MKNVFIELQKRGIRREITIEEDYISAHFTARKINVLGFFHVTGANTIMELLSNLDLIEDGIRKDGESKDMRQKVKLLRSAGYTVLEPGGKHD